MNVHKDNGGRSKPRAKGVVIRHGNRTAPGWVRATLEIKAAKKRNRKKKRNLKITKQSPT